MAPQDNKPAEKKYKQIIAAMKKDLEEWKLQPHQTFLSDRQAIERYGGSRITVRQAFSQLEREGFIYRQRGKGTMISPNRGQRHRQFAYIGDCVVNSGCEPMWIKGIEDYLINHNSSLVFCNLENNIDRARLYLERFSQTGIDGIIFLPMVAPTEKNVEIIRFFQKHHIPFILLDRTIAGLEEALPCVMTDHYDGGRQITQHLLSLGHRRIAFFHALRMDYCTSLAMRYSGYQDALIEAGIQPDPDLTGMTTLGTMHFQVKRWLNMKNPPTAIIVEHDLTLIHMFEIMQNQGVRIPDDISLAGYDDIRHLAMPIPHTTVQAPHMELGQNAAMQLLDMVENDITEPQQIVLPVTLKIRQSTGINQRINIHPLEAVK